MTILRLIQGFKSNLEAMEGEKLAKNQSYLFLKIFLSSQKKKKISHGLEHLACSAVTYSLQNMTKGRWKLTPEMAAIEAYAVFIRKDTPTRMRPKTLLLHELQSPQAYDPFLKLCLEYDDTLTLRQFRAGLLWVVKAIGPERFAKQSGLHRVSLYRMLSPKGNPRLEGIMRILKALRFNVWIVDQEFIARRARFVRPKDIKPEVVFVKPGRKIPHRKIKL
jgi:probable addiction module antidote protein